MMKQDSTVRKDNIVDIANKMSAQINAERQSVVGKKQDASVVPREQMPLVRELPKAKPFPLHALLSLQTVVETVMSFTQTPDSLVGQCVLSAVNYAAQGHVDVDAGFGARPISCFFLSSAESGARKSAVDTQVWKAVREYQEYLESILGEDAQVADARGKMPLSPVILATEPTAEGLVQHLQRSIGSIALASDDAGAFIGGFAMSKDQVLKTLAKMATLWDGKQITSLRAGGTKSRFVSRKRMCMSLMAQRSVIAQLIGLPIAREQGFLSRCLVCEPESLIGTRKFRLATDDELAVVEEFNDGVRRLLKTPLPLVAGSDNKLAPRVIPLCAKAVEMYAAFVDEVEAECVVGGRLRPIADFASKSGEHAMRLATTLLVYDHPDAKSLHQDYLAAGTTLTKWYMGEMLRLSGAEFDIDLDLAQRLLDWLRERKRIGEPFSLVEVYQRSHDRIRNAKTARKIIGILIEHGWVEPADGPVEFDGMPRREGYRLI